MKLLCQNEVILISYMTIVISWKGGTLVVGDSRLREGGGLFLLGEISKYGADAGIRPQPPTPHPSLLVRKISYTSHLHAHRYV